MNSIGIIFWNIKDNRQNGKPIIDPQIQTHMIWLRANLDSVAIKFHELVGDFSKLAAHMSPNTDRYWASNLIEVVISRSEDEEILIEVHRRDDPDQNNPSLTLGFDKPKNWNEPVLAQPICASGKSPKEIVLLGDLLIQQWPECRKMKYRKILDPYTQPSN